MRGKRRHIRSGLAGTCAAAFLLAAGCGTDAGGGHDDVASTMPTVATTMPSRDSGTATPSASQAPTMSQAPTTLRKPSVPPEAGQTTLKGQLAEPVEAGCVVLSTDDGSYVLLGVPAKVGKLDPGTALVVRGSVAESTMTTCQQGTPFKVDTATPA